LRFFWACLFSFLPDERRARYEREGLSLAAGTVISGVLELALAGYLVVHFFARYRAHYMQNFVGGEHAGSFLFGATLWVGFLFFSAWGLLGFYLFTEGLVRAFAATVTHEPCGSLVVLLSDLAVRRAAASRARRRQDPLVPDESTRAADGTLVIATCRDRGWDEMTTLEVDENHFAVVAHEVRALGPRRHVYRLAPLAPGRAIRKLVRYSLDDLA
jgi:hypothetical protein